MTEVDHRAVRRDIDVIESCLRAVKVACKRRRTPLPEGLGEDVNIAMQHMLVAATSLGGNMEIIQAIMPATGTKDLSRIASSLVNGPAVE